MKKRLKNYVAIVLDRSTSIRDYGLTNQVIQTFNSLKDTLQKKSALKNQDTYVTLLTFASVVDEPAYKHANVNLIPNLSEDTYRPNGNTCLFDAVAKAVEIFDQVPVDEQTSFVVMVFTDGEENKSVYMTAAALKQVIVNRENKGNWTFTFQLPHKTASFCRQFGVSEDNVSGWEATVAGTQEMGQTTCGGIETYMDDRATGSKQTKTFFKVTPDLSGVNVKKELDDLAGQYHIYMVQSESIIRNFVEGKTGKDYIPGTAYYQLVKPEKVQPSKEVLIKEKNGKKIYGGQGARDLIGLPNGHAKITPGNHDNYDIFIQSKSVNRILPRGSGLLLAK